MINAYMAIASSGIGAMLTAAEALTRCAMWLGMGFGYQAIPGSQT